MVANPLLNQILSDERLTRNLGDAEARVLVEWLVEQAEELTRIANSTEADRAVTWLCRRGRAVAHFVRLWCQENARGAAGQLAAAERFVWPLPDAEVDPYELMQGIVSCEGDQFWQRRRLSRAA
ncbi:MAG TPA: hypothetical protein VN688_24335 [Gemmataceae bacterium]|nr:hypothetical protein [Gemmataceae bacterium]